MRPAATDSSVPSIAQLGPGVSSAASLAGLPALRRLRPRTWHQDILALTPGAPRSPRATVRAVFSSQANAHALPRNAGDGSRIKRPRACAGRLVALVGDRPAAELNDEQRLAGLHQDFIDSGVAASTASRTVSLARTVLRSWCKHVGLRCRLDGRGRPRNTRIGPPRSRPVPSPQEVGELLAALDGAPRLALALAAGAGLLESEILGLRYGDLGLADGSVVVRSGGVRGRSGQRCLRVESVAGWAWKLLLEMVGDPRRSPPDALLFPNRRDPGRPRSSFAPAVRTACVAAFGDDGPSFTLGAARRLWQRIQIDAGMPSAHCRQSWSLDEHRGALPSWGVLAQGLAWSWQELCAPPVDLRGRRLHVPPKKPKGCMPVQPERGAGAADPPSPLPAYCQARPLDAAPRPSRTGRATVAAAPPIPEAAVPAAPEAGASDGLPPTVPARHSVLPKRDLDRLARQLGERLQVQLAASPPPSPDGPAEDADLDRRLRAIDRRLGVLARHVAEVSRRRGAQDLVLAVLAGAGGGFAAQNADELVERIQHVLRSVGVPDEELVELQAPTPVGPGGAVWPGPGRQPP